MEVELQGQDLKSVIEMEDSLLKQKGEVCFKTFFRVFFKKMQCDPIWSSVARQWMKQRARLRVPTIFSCRRSYMFGKWFWTCCLTMAEFQRCIEESRSQGWSRYCSWRTITFHYSRLHLSKFVFLSSVEILRNNHIFVVRQLTISIEITNWNMKTRARFVIFLYVFAWKYVLALILWCFCDLPEVKVRHWRSSWTRRCSREIT